MKTSALFQEYIWLVNTIWRARRITFEEINERWVETEMSGRVELARSTFNRHKDAIEDMFGIYIDCDRQNGYKYFIGNEEVLRGNSVQNWMLSSLSVNNIISESLSLQKRILLEPIPMGNEYLEKVIEAMKRSVRIQILYRKYGTEQPKELNFEPYCLKLFKQRWYVLGHFHREVKDGPDIDYFGTFSFDRILSLELTTTKFEIDPSFDAEAYFSECYGVMANDDTRPVKIVIRVFDYERFYLKDLSIHHSQHEIGRGEDYIDFELFVRPTYDLEKHLVSLGDQVKVLSPQWLADEIAQIHYDAVCLYDPEMGEDE